MAQIALGAINVILLAPIWLQMMHLLVADVFWIPLVLASADLLFTDRCLSIPHAQKTKSDATWDVVPRSQSSNASIFSY
jgi:heme A synthase